MDPLQLYLFPKGRREGNIILRSREVQKESRYQVHPYQTQPLQDLMRIHQPSVSPEKSPEQAMMRP